MTYRKADMTQKPGEEGAFPAHPIITPGNHPETLGRVADVLALLQHVEFSGELHPSARMGYFWINSMLVQSVRYVSEELRVQRKSGS